MKKSTTLSADENCAKCKEMEKEKQEEKVIKFLMGLNESNSLIRTHILALKELPGLDAAFDSVSQEETHRKITHSLGSETSAMYVNSQGKQIHGNTYEKHEPLANTNVSNSGSGRGRTKIVCTYCNMSGHSRENCYKLIGYPSDGHSGNQRFSRGRAGHNGGRGRGYGRGHANDVFSLQSESSSSSGSKKMMESTPQLSAEQISQLLSLLRSSNSEANESDKDHVLMAGMTCATAITECESWIVDSGATNHFTHNEKLLTDLSELTRPCFIKLPNGCSVEVTKMGNCQLKNDIYLKGVLWVPQFRFNLLSVSKLVADANYSVIFTNSGCFIQDSQKRLP